MKAKQRRRFRREEGREEEEGDGSSRCVAGGFGRERVPAGE